MDTLTEKIRERVRLPCALVGIGNAIRGDDGFGPKLIASLRDRTSLFLFDCGTVPENYVSAILKTKARTVILLDAANMQLSAGRIAVLEVWQIAETSFSTHAASLTLMARHLKEADPNVEVFVVAVQPKDTAFGLELSGKVREGLHRLEEIFCRY